MLFSLILTLLVLCVLCCRWQTWLHRPNFKKKKRPKQSPRTLEEHLKLQRRASCGYPPSESSSDEESSNKAGKKKTTSQSRSSLKMKQKDGYTLVPSHDLRDAPLTNWDWAFHTTIQQKHRIVHVPFRTWTLLCYFQFTWNFPCIISRIYVI